MAKDKFMYGSFKFGNKEVPATKNGLPNCVFLSKEERVVVKSFSEQKKKGKTETSLKELTEQLAKLK
jgi:hypothetical protein